MSSSPNSMRTSSSLNLGLGEFEKINSTYAIEGDALFITTTEEDGVEILEFQRIDDRQLRLPQLAWGALKAAWRR